MAKMSLVEQVQHARRAGVPLLAIATADPAATILDVATNVNSGPIVQWDLLRGCQPVNEAGKPVAQDCETGEGGPTVGNPAAFLVACQQFPPHVIAFFHMADQFIEGPSMQPPVVQGVWNLRDAFKQDWRTLVLLGPSIRLPAALQNDVVVLDEPLPTSEQLGQIVSNLDQAACACPQCAGTGRHLGARCNACKGKGKRDREPMNTETVVKVVEAVQGLSAFAAEQVVAMALRKDGLDLPHCWESKRKQIELTPGLSVWRGTETFDDVGGLKNIKRFLGLLLKGSEPPGAIVFVDEIEKLLAGSSGAMSDSSGVSQGILQALLTFMQDHESSGMIFLGPPGAGKSLVGKCAGNEAGIPTICFDSNGMKGSLVGQSEQNMRNGLKVVDAVSNGRALWLATCLEGTTIVQLADGKLIPIRSITAGAVALSANMSSGKIRPAATAAKTCRTAEILRIGHSFGELLCTADHLLFRACATGIEEIQAGNLCRDDYLASPLNLPHGSGIMNPDLAYLVGYTCGDGGWSGNRVYWTEEDEILANHIAQICKELFGTRASIHRRSRADAYSIYLSHDYMGNFGDRFASALCGTHNIAVPIEISEGDANVVASFLSGLFDAEGSVSSQDLIAFTSTSKILRDQVLMLLWRFGIYATCAWHVPDAPRVPSYRLAIAGDSAVRFAGFIGFRHQEKQRKVKNIPPRPITGKRGRSVESIPVFWETLVADGFLPRHDKTGAARLQTVERKRLVGILEEMRKDGLECLTTQQWLGFTWSRVKTLANAGTSEVYDFEVPNGHNFIAGGLVVHNCNSIGSLPPELRRRFAFGTFYFDLPDGEEREAIWDYYQAKYGIDAGSLPVDDGWTGAEIKTCCLLTHRLGISLAEASEFVVPVCISARAQIEELRKQADGRYVSASRSGVYRVEATKRTRAVM